MKLPTTLKTSAFIFLSLTFTACTSNQPTQEVQAPTTIKLNPECQKQSVVIGKQCQESKVYSLDLKTLQRCYWLREKPEVFLSNCDRMDLSTNHELMLQFLTDEYSLTKNPKSIYYKELVTRCEKIRIGSLTLPELQYCTQVLGSFGFDADFSLVKKSAPPTD